jgi:hypothetical protein
MLMIKSTGGGFEFLSIGSHFFTRFFEIDSTRKRKLQFLTLSVEQSVVLATRSHPIDLSLRNGTIQDGGTAFVDHLLSRESTFGSLEFVNSLAIDDDNLQHLLQARTIEHLRFPHMNNDLAHLPFSMHLVSLQYAISWKSFLEIDFQVLNIVARKLGVRIYHEYNDGEVIPPEFMLSFWRRVVDLGHFGELSIDFHSKRAGWAVLAYSYLTVFPLCPESFTFNWEAQMATLLKCFEGHKELRIFGLVRDDESFGPDFLYLRQLLSHNRSITVINPGGFDYTDDGSIDELYSLNRFFNGSANLVAEPLTERSSSAMTALMEMALKNFQRSSPLLYDHFDV